MQKVKDEPYKLYSLPYSKKCHTRNDATDIKKTIVKKTHIKTLTKKLNDCHKL